MGGFMKLLNKYWALVLALTFFVLVTSCRQNAGLKEGAKISCNAEKRTADHKYFVGNKPDFLFSDGRQQSDREAHSGKYSVLATKKHKFVLSHTLKGVGPDMHFKVSVWRKSKSKKGVLVISDKTAKKLYRASDVVVEKGKDGWEKLEEDFFTPPNFVSEDVKIYCWSLTGDSAYFDDIEIVHTHKTYPVYKEEPLVLVFDTLRYRKFLDKRIEAFNNGVLQSGDDDWVKGMIFGDGKMMKAKMRLKGDWLDHLIGDKWSFRIKMRKDFAWKRLRVFSIQTPKARSFLDEWYAHKLYESKDILTTRYGFVPVIIDNKSRGLYAWEEHFVKQLVESRKRREGPILKLSEDAFWQVQRVAKVNNKWLDMPYYGVSVIEPFSQGKTMKNPTLRHQFLIAQKLMQQYKYAKAKPADIFDMTKLARYYAMLDITHARHGMAWHNQRLYYNPVICKLEPIAYDGYTEKENLNFSIQDNMAFKLLNAKKDAIDVDFLNYYFLFQDSTFLNLYLSYLEEFSSEQYADSMTRVLKAPAMFYDSLIRMEFPGIYFDMDFLSKSARGVRSYLPELRAFLKQKLNNDQSDDKLKVKSSRRRHPDIFNELNTPHFFVTAYLENSNADSMLIGVHNFYGKPIVLVGMGPVKDRILDYFPKRDTIPAYVMSESGVTRMVRTEAGSAFLFFKVAGFDEPFSVDIKPWPYPKGITPQQELMKLADVEHCAIVDSVSGSDLFIKKGVTKVDKPIIIPKGYKVHFEPGTQIDLVRQAMFISYSPVFMQGTKENPVVISSSDKTGNGLTVLQAEGRSVVDNVRFESLNTLNYKGWTLTGSATFYESDVDISNAEFIGNQCEDALNIVRSDFVLRNSRFDHIWGDAFDADFSTGLVDHGLFTNIGNDAIDFSTCKISIVNTVVNGAEDKGVSGGEDSHLTVKNTTIINANIGLASKDLSSLDVLDSKVDSCKYGVVLLQKKPEYGPATMNLQKVTITNCETKMLIEKGSKVIFNRKTINGNRKKVAEMFY